MRRLFLLRSQIVAKRMGQACLRSHYVFSAPRDGHIMGTRHLSSIHVRLKEDWKSKNKWEVKLIW